MKKTRALALALACALSLSLLTACGGSGSGSDTSDGAQTSQSGTTGSGLDQSGAGSSLPDGSLPDASQPDASGDGAVSAGGSASASQEEPGQPVQAELKLNRTDFSLFTVGSSFQLKASGVPEGASVTWSSSNPDVASVAENGTVTYVAAGSATITAAAGDLTAVCKVYCKAQEAEQPVPDEPEDSGSSSAGGDSSGDSSAPSEDGQVDLSAFYTAVSSAHEFPSFMALAGQQVMEAYYPGLSGISTQQCLVYANQMGMNMGELVLVQVSDSADVDAVKEILQTRIDNMVNGGAWYPEPTRVWSENSRIVSNGSYVMMVVNEECDAIVEEFNALF